MHSLVSACDAAIFQSVAPCRPARHPILALTAITVASGIVFLDGSVIPVALPVIGRALALKGSETQWVLNAYLLPLATLAMLGGAIGDRFGRCQIVLLGIAIFAVATLACASADSFTMLVISRFFQGIGAALLYPNSLSAMGELFSGSAQRRAVGIWSAVAAIVSGVAPPLAGWSIDHGHWRVAFLLSLPLALVAATFSYRYVPRAVNKADTRLDIGGSLLGALGLGFLIWQLTDKPTVLGVLLAVGLLSIYVWYERRLGTHASMPIALLTSRVQLGINGYTFLLYVPFNLFLVYVPFVLLQALHRSGTATGLAFVPMQIIFVVISPLMSVVVDRVGVRWPLLAGAVLTAVGCILVLRVGKDASYWTGLLPAVFMVATGMSLAAAPLTALVLESVDRPHMGIASGLNSAITRLAALAATAMLSATIAKEANYLLWAFPAVMTCGAISSVLAAASTSLIRSPTSI
jgi:MFS family permease